MPRIVFEINFGIILWIVIVLLSIISGSGCCVSSVDHVLGFFEYLFEFGAFFV